LIRRRRAQEIIKAIKTLLWASTNRPRRNKKPEETLPHWRKIVRQTKSHPEVKR
jgi:hypothetical protein